MYEESAVCAPLWWVKKRLIFRIFGRFIFTASVTKGDSLDSLSDI
jgi:hypothetical protein